jgi:ribosomal protein S18 acetylase RimI-like enzyme
MPTVRPLAPADVPAVAALLAVSFDGDAGYRYLFPDPGERTPGLASFFARNLAVHLPFGCSQVLVDREGEVLGTVTVRPPGGVPISSWTMLRNGLLPFAARHGLGAVRRLLWLKRTYDALQHELADGLPHWHVHMMAIRAGEQGRGHGSGLIAEVLERTVGAPVVLTTHSEENVTFYRRVGFEVVTRRLLRGSWDVWGMRRPAILPP